MPSADTDMATDGVLLLASNHTSEIHIHFAAPDEYTLGPFEGAALRAERENERQERSDLVAIASCGPAHAQSAKFKFSFIDIYSGSYADPIETLKVDDYLKDGGNIIDHRNSTAS